MRGNGYKHVVYCRLCLYLFRSDMPFTTNYTSAAFHQKVGETTVEKGEHDNERTNLRAGALLTSTCTGPDEIGKVDPKSTEARTKDQTKQKVSWRNPVPWHTAGPVTTCLSLWMTILKKRKKIELSGTTPGMRLVAPASNSSELKEDVDWMKTSPCPNSTGRKESMSYQKKGEINWKSVQDFPHSLDRGVI